MPSKTLIQVRALYEAVKCPATRDTQGGRGIAFDTWMDRVKEAVENISGLDFDELPEMPWGEWFNKGMRARDAAKRALDLAEEEDDTFDDRECIDDDGQPTEMSGMVSMYGNKPPSETSLRRRGIAEDRSRPSTTRTVVDSLAELVTAVFVEGDEDNTVRRDCLSSALRRRRVVEEQEQPETLAEEEGEEGAPLGYCPVCDEACDSTCRCSSRIVHTVDHLKRGHGRGCPNGHRSNAEGTLAVDGDGNVLIGRSSESIQESRSGGEAEGEDAEAIGAIQAALAGVPLCGKSRGAGQSFAEDVSIMAPSSDADILGAVSAIESFDAALRESQESHRAQETEAGGDDDQDDVGDDAGDDLGEDADESSVSEEEENGEEDLDEASVMDGDWGGRWNAATKAASSAGKSLASKLSKSTDAKYTFLAKGMPQSEDGGTTLWFECESSGNPSYYLGFQLTSGKGEEQKWNVRLMKGEGLGSAKSVGSERGLTSSELAAAVGRLADKV